MLEEADVWIIAIALLAALASIGIGVWSNISTKRSNNIMERDMIVRHRPWILMSDPKIVFVRTHNKNFSSEEFLSMDFDDKAALDPFMIKWTYHIENVGLLPARNLKVFQYEDWGGLEKTKPKYDPDDNSNGRPLLPGEKKMYYIDITFAKFNQFPNALRFIQNSICYEFRDHENKKQIQIISKIWSFQGDGSFLEQHYWIDP